MYHVPEGDPRYEPRVVKLCVQGRASHESRTGTAYTLGSVTNKEGVHHSSYESQVHGKHEAKTSAIATHILRTGTNWGSCR